MCWLQPRRRKFFFLSHPSLSFPLCFTFVDANGMYRSRPKLFIHVFIGSRLALLADSGESMSGFDRFINYASMAVFGMLGAFVGLLIYRRTMARAEELAVAAAAAGGRSSFDSDIGGYDDGDDDDDDPSRLEAGDPLLDGGRRHRRSRSNEDPAALGNGEENGRMTHPDELDQAALMDDDDISLWDTHGDGYHDWDDEEETRTGNGTGIGGGIGGRK